MEGALQKLLKYIIEGLAVAAVAYYIPQKKTDIQEILAIAVTAASTFLVLDLLAPSVGSGARMGAGFGIGANQVGFGLGGGAEGFLNIAHDRYFGDEIQRPENYEKGLVCFRTPPSFQRWPPNPVVNPKKFGAK